MTRERQRRLLYTAAFLRALSIGLMAVLIGLYAARLGLSATQIGVVLSAALWGAAIAAFLTMVIGPKVPERALLFALCALPVAGGAMFLSTESFPLIVAAEGRRASAHRSEPRLHRGASRRSRLRRAR